MGSLALQIHSKGSWEPWGLSCPQFWAKLDQIILILVINCTFFALNSNYFLITFRNILPCCSYAYSLYVCLYRYNLSYFLAAETYYTSNLGHRCLALRHMHLLPRNAFENLPKDRYSLKSGPRPPNTCHWGGWTTNHA